MDTEKTEFDYQKIIDDLESFDERMCCAILLGHLQSIAKRCGINPDEYNDSASLTCAIADVLDERLATPDTIHWVNFGKAVEELTSQLKKLG